MSLPPLDKWLSRRKPDRVVVKPSGESFVVPDSPGRWQELAAVLDGAEIVEAFRGEVCVGLWKASAVAAQTPQPVQPAQAAPSGSADVTMLRDLVKAQGEMLREMLTTQTTVMRAMREGMEAMTDFRAAAGGDDGGEDGEDADLKRMFKDALRGAAARGFSKPAGDPPKESA